jgi:hypothetical protein
MANGWTPELRRKQSTAIKRWRPWERSTGPRTPEGKATVSRNAFKGGERPALRQLARLLRQIEGEKPEQADAHSNTPSRHPPL